jgi:hypothetical protein
MANEMSEGSQSMSKALDLMVQAGWVHGYAYKVDAGFAIDWTETGKSRIEALWLLIQELGADKFTGRIWFGAFVVARTRFESRPV